VYQISDVVLSFRLSDSKSGRILRLTKPTLTIISFKLKVTVAALFSVGFSVAADAYAHDDTVH
jgi:hypothetical protein